MNPTVRKMNGAFAPVRKWSVHAADFLSCSPANLLVNGGRQETRLDLLLHELRLQEGISVVLTSSSAVELALAAAAAHGGLNRRLILCSDRFPNYDPLCGIGITAGAAFFANAAEGLGYHDRSAITGYYTAVCQLYGRLHDRPLSLRELYAFCGSSAVDLTALAAETDADIYTDMIESAAGAKGFRDVLRLLRNAFAGFSAPEGSGLSLITAAAAARPTILCIRPVGDPHLVGSLLAAELTCAMERPFHLLVCDSRLLQDEAFAEAFHAKKNEPGTTALLTENVALCSDSDRLQRGFARRIILLDGSVDITDLQTSLSALGTYQRFEETSSTARPMKLPIVPSFCRSETIGITQFECPRVRYEEVRDSMAVLFSPDTGLIVAAHLKT